MTRMSKQGEKRAISPRRPRPPSPKTGSKKDNLPQGFRVHQNATTNDHNRFIPNMGARS